MSVIKLPQLKSLSIKTILNLTINNINISENFPENTYDKLPNSESLLNILNTIARRKLKEFVHTDLDKREKDILINKGLNVTDIPKIVKIFKNSKNVSYNKGRTYFLMGTRPTVIKWKHYEIECDRFEEEKKKTVKLEEKIK